MKRIYSICLIVFLCLFQVTPAFASVVTSSDWTLDEDTATSSDWNYFTPFDWDSYYQDYGISPAVISIPSVTNTVYYPGVFFEFRYYDMNNNVKIYSVSPDSSGHVSVYRPDDFAKPYQIGFYLRPSALPPSGTYDYFVGIRSDTNIVYTGAYLWSQKSTSNAAPQYSSQNITGDNFQNGGGDVYLHSVVDLNSSVGAPLQTWFNTSSVSFNLSLDISIRFSPTKSEPTYSTAGGSRTSQDIQQDISNSAVQIADNTAAIDGTLKQLIQHISDQLHALWDQMYNYMHVPLVNNDNARTQRIIDRMDEGFDINVEVLDRNFHDLMENDDKNTNQITNGYDNSTFNSANSQLDSSVNQYDQAETGIFDSVKENVTGFTIPDFTSNVQVLTAVGFCSNYLQRLFNAIGLYNLPITVSLVMIFVLMVLGYYRVRSS